MRKIKVSIVLLAVFASILPARAFAHVGTPIYPIVFPVSGSSTYTDTFGDSRSGGRTHEGADIFGTKGQPLFAAAPGVVTSKKYGDRSGYMLIITDILGNKYFYAHLNNDRPGTDDGKGGEKAAFAVGIEIGSEVLAGQVVGYLGDSGNAENTAPHLHFEIWPGGGQAVCPNNSLDKAKRVGGAITKFGYTKPVIKKLAPNPFSPNRDGYTDKTILKFSIPKYAHVTLRILNYKGEVALITNNKLFTAGDYSISWNGKNNNGQFLADGGYLYELITKRDGLFCSYVGLVKINKNLLPPGDNVPKITGLKSTPNPFNASAGKNTTISYNLSTDSIVRVVLYNYKGAVKTILNGRYRLSGNRSLNYNGTGQNNAVLPNGNYRLEISAKNSKGTATKSMVLGIR